MYRKLQTNNNHEKRNDFSKLIVIVKGLICLIIAKSSVTSFYCVNKNDIKKRKTTFCSHKKTIFMRDLKKIQQGHVTVFRCFQLLVNVSHVTVY